MQETWVWSLGQEDPLETEIAISHSNILAWRIPWTKEPRRLWSLGSQSQTRLSGYHSFTHSWALRRAQWVFNPRKEVWERRFTKLFLAVVSGKQKILFFFRYCLAFIYLFGTIMWFFCKTKNRKAVSKEEIVTFDSFTSQMSKWGLGQCSWMGAQKHVFSVSTGLGTT